MRNTNKKGFTIVELVIVIAVIAILAAVLIPTFSGIIAKARLSADKKAVHEMNTFVAMEEADTFEKALAALEKNKVNTENLSPISAGYSFVWNAETKQFELVETTEDTVDIKESIKDIDVTVTTADYLALAIENGSKSIKLDANIEIKDVLTVGAGEDVVIDLNDKSLTVTGYSDKANGNHNYAFDVKGNLTLKNGTINARGVQTYAGANLVIESGVVINAIDTNGGACVYNRDGATVTINGGEFNVVGEAVSATKGAAAVINAGGTTTINGGKFNSNVGPAPYAIIAQGGEIIINNAEVNSARGCVQTQYSGKVTINGGSYTSTWVGHSAYVFATNSGTGVFNFNGGTIKADTIDHIVWEDSGCTFTNGNNSGVTFEKNGEYYDIVK